MNLFCALWPSHTNRSLAAAALLAHGRGEAAVAAVLVEVRLAAVVAHVADLGGVALVGARRGGVVGGAVRLL